jgi:hypothetical protein
MLDTLAPNVLAAHDDLGSRAGAAPFVAQPDGYVVVASKLECGSVKPPYRHQHWHEWRGSLEEAASFYADIERGEYESSGDWRAVAIIPTFGGIPRPDMALGVMERAKLVKEAEAA